MQASPNLQTSEEAPAEPTTPWYAPLTSSPVRTLACLVAFVGAGFAASYLLPPQFLARARIILPNSSSRSSMAGLASSLGLSTGSDSGSLPMFAAIMRSEAMLTRISNQTGLTRKQLRKQFVARDDVKSNTIEITSLGTDREKALGVVRSSLAALSEIAARINLPMKEDQTTRLASALRNRQRDLATNERALQAFLRTAKTLPGGGLSSTATKDPLDQDGKPLDDATSIQPGLGYRQQLSALEIQLRKIDSSAAAIKETSKAQEATPPLDLPPVKLWAERIAAAQARLAELKPRYRADSPEIIDAEQALTAVQSEMRREVDRYLSAVRASLTGPAQTLSVARAGIESQIREVKKYVDAAPDEAITYLRLFRNVATSEAVVNQIRLMYEKARVEQSNDPNTWAVLDSPEIDEEFDSRKLGRNLVLGAVLGLMLAYWLGSRDTARAAR